MSIGLIGKKSGMSRLFLEDGESVPVTAVSVCGNFIADIKTKEKNGYNALVVSKTKKSNNLKIHPELQTESPEAFRSLSRPKKNIH